MTLRIQVAAHFAGREASPPARDLLRRAVRAALAAEGVERAEISVTLLDDAGMAALNARYLGEDAPTDVLAFPLHEGREPPIGDIYIGHEQALSQAAALGVSVSEELARLAIHGTLHVLGQEHPEGEGREGSPMWQQQERILGEVMAPS